MYLILRQLLDVRWTRNPHGFNAEKRKNLARPESKQWLPVGGRQKSVTLVRMSSTSFTRPKARKLIERPRSPMYGE